jgi:hypothetical protein
MFGKRCVRALINRSAENQVERRAVSEDRKRGGSGYGRRELLKLADQRGGGVGR